jgi:hypothetical protein
MSKLTTDALYPTVAPKIQPAKVPTIIFLFMLLSFLMFCLGYFQVALSHWALSQVALSVFTLAPVLLFVSPPPPPHAVNIADAKIHQQLFLILS